MRILHVIPALAPRFGGPPKVIAEMCRELARHGTGGVRAKAIKCAGDAAYFRRSIGFVYPRNIGEPGNSRAEGLAVGRSGREI